MPQLLSSKKASDSNMNLRQDAGGRAAARPSLGSKTGGAVLYCDLPIDPAQEEEIVRYFYEVFRPCAQTFAGYRDLKILKLRTVIQARPGAAPAARYRFQLTYESETLRQAWTNSPEHAALWPRIENALIDKAYPVALYEEA